MMNSTQKIKKIVLSDWAIGAFLLIVFLIANGYTYGWDDQHVEIPLLKSLIDPSLYVGDYYVESLKKNFISILYPILARLISVEQIPMTYLLLYLLSRYFLFFWIYKLWHVISKEKFTAFCCTLMIILLGRVEEFLYRTFSHQEFALAIIVAGMYFFYKERFVLAGAIFGVAANFHALYSLFPFSYMCVYLLVRMKKHEIKTLIKAVLSFSAALTPLLIWIFKKYFAASSATDPSIYQNWIGLYRIACPQNFIFYDKSLPQVFGSWKTFLDLTTAYWFLISFYVLHLAQNEKFRKDLKTNIAILTGFGMLVFSLVFSHIFPTRFILDLNLVRNTQYILFLLMGYTVILFIDTANKKTWLTFVALILLIPLIRFRHYVAPLTGLSLLFVLSIDSFWNKKKSIQHYVLLGLFALGLLVCFAGMLKFFMVHRYSRSALISLGGIWGVTLCVYIAHFFIKKPKIQSALKILLILVPFIAFSVNYIYYHKLHKRIERTGGGFWQLQRNWIDMQNYVRENTSKDAMLLVPHDMEMGGFRIRSERKIIISYRDCGVIGFDYAAAVEWQKRLKDIESFQVIIKNSIAPAIANAIVKYKVNYIVFMRYMDPGQNNILQPVYSNDVFALYKVLPNPI